MNDEYIDKLTGEIKLNIENNRRKKLAEAYFAKHPTWKLPKRLYQLMTLSE